MYYKIGTIVLASLVASMALHAKGPEPDPAIFAIDSIQSAVQKTKDTRGDYLKQSYVPAALAATSLGILAVPDLKYKIQDRLNWNASEKVNLYDDEWRYGPLGAVALLSIAGVRGEHRLLERVAIGGISYILADFIVYRTKQATQVTRPNPAYGTTSFPSQHASMAFVGATLLHREFGHVSPWISVGGYGMATWVAYSRIARNRHFLPDVLMGSAVGMLATNATFWAYDALAPKLKKQLTFSPLLTKNGAELILSYQF